MMEKLMLQEVVQAVGGRLMWSGASHLCDESAGSCKDSFGRHGEVSTGDDALFSSGCGDSTGGNAPFGSSRDFNTRNRASRDRGDVADTEILSVVTDSRKITPGCVFFALAGDRFDGHAYVQAALEKGAAGCVVMREPQELLPGKFYILVPDTRRALGDLAHYYRMKFDVCVVGITGSVGKTTCREMVEAVLSRHFRVHATAGNFNNDIGLPMTIFGLTRKHQVLVLEMGMNHPGEISRLSQIAAPDIAVITNIGTAHIGNLGSRENIFLAKKEIFDGMPSGAKAVLCGDDDFLPQIARDPSLLARYHIFFAGKSGICNYRVEEAHVEVTNGQDTEAGKRSGQEESAGDAGLALACRSGRDAQMATVCRLALPDPAEAFPWLRGKQGHTLPAGAGQVPAETAHGGKEREEPVPAPLGTRHLDLRIPAVGMHLVYPASIAAAVGDLLGMPPEEIREGIAAFAGQRMACEQYGDILLFDDTYNASPDSMKSSLQVLACMPAEKKVAVLGDMLEQGDFAEDLHREVGAAAAEAGLDTLVTVGPLSVHMAEEARRCGLWDVRPFPDRDAAAAAVEEITRPGTALLFKASHGLALDRLAAVSRKKAEGILDGIQDPL